MKAIILLCLCLALSGCAGATAYLQAHATTIAVVGATAAAVSGTESAVVNGIELEKEVAKK
ncbi:MAG: hypothetical protein PHY45_02400 [Rhodocyclaceae bacterium]|nr:hypothetical protein [Rhodocyclaceae bacterium]